MSLVRPTCRCLLLAIAIASAGCSTNPFASKSEGPPLPSSIAASAEPGHPIGLRPSPATRGVVLEVSLYSIANARANVGQALAATSTLIADQSNEPVAPTTELVAERVRLLPADLTPPQDFLAGTLGALGETKLLQSQIAAIAPGSTLRLRFAGDAATPVDLLIAAPGFVGTSDSLPTLMIRATPREQAAQTDDATSDFDTGQRTPQVIVVDWPLSAVNGDAFALLVPVTRGRERASRLLRIRAVDPANDAQLQSLVANAAKQLIPTTAPASTQPVASPRVRSMLEGLDRAKTPGSKRRTLAFIHVQSGAEVAAELLALSPDDKAVDLFAEATRQALFATPESATSVQAAWLVDRAAIVAAAAAAGNSVLDRAAAASLSSRYGEVGRDPSALAALATASGSRDDFQKRLQAEHLVLLDDASPASRVRAYDWLAVRELAPPGYDPLADAKSRRAALDAYAESRQPATPTTTTP